jgi:hypothetical protein
MGGTNSDAKPFENWIIIGNTAMSEAVVRNGGASALPIFALAPIVRRVRGNYIEARCEWAGLPTDRVERDFISFRDEIHVVRQSGEHREHE